MTALAEYDRLESTGIWRSAPDAQRRDVIISLGDATLTISDMADRPLGHWSLAAIERHPGQDDGICYQPGVDAPERLEIADDEMIAAIERVRTAVQRSRPHPGRLRLLLIGAVSVLVAVVLIFWLPGALVQYAANVVPDAKRTEIGARLMEVMTRSTGRGCSTPAADRALAALGAKLMPEGGGRLIIVPAGVATSESLPGHVVLLNKSLVEDFEEPSVVAGFILAELTRQRHSNPMGDMFEFSGVFPAVRLLTTGDIDDATLAEYSEHLLTDGHGEPPTDALLERFREAGVPSTPYALALDISGETTLALIEADPGTPEGQAPLLSDEDWVALQGICDG